MRAFIAAVQALILSILITAACANSHHQPGKSLLRPHKADPRSPSLSEEEAGFQQDIALPQQQQQQRRRRKQRLAFVVPPGTVSNGSAGVGADGLAFYHPGQQVNISWTTPFRATSLQLWQKKEDGGYMSSTIADSFSRDETSIIWQAETLLSGETNSTYHFELVNARNAQCKDCSTNSPTFQLHQAVTTTSSSSSSSSTSTTSSTHSPTSSHMTTAAAGHSSSTTSTTAPSSSYSSNTSATATNNALDLGVGLGVGLGVPFLALFAIFLFFCTRSRRNQKRNNYYNNLNSTTGSGRRRSDGTPYPDISRPMDATTSAMGMRESATSLAPHPSQQAMIAPPRPSYGAGSEFSGNSHGGSSNGSAQSWFEPFDFERPGNGVGGARYGGDSMSQLRRSIASRGSIRPSSDGLSFQGAGSGVAGPGVPSMPSLPPHAVTTDEGMYGRENRI